MWVSRRSARTPATLATSPPTPWVTVGTRLCSAAPASPLMANTRAPNPSGSFRKAAMALAHHRYSQPTASGAAAYSLGSTSTFKGDSDDIRQIRSDHRVGFNRTADAVWGATP